MHSPMRLSVPLLSGLKLRHRGKVRDTYELTDELLLSVATDAISIFDFVLNALIPGKGIILNAMNYFWSTHLAQFGIKTHLVAAGAAIDRYLPESLRGNSDLQARAVVIRKLEMVDREFIARILITGSGYESYRKTGQICGSTLPYGFQDGDALPYVLDTPTTKAEVGHDQHVSADQVRNHYPRQTRSLIDITQIASSYAASRGIKLADTKFEFGKCGTLADEILTPDSSRFYSLKDWEESRKKEVRKAPISYDKQFVREWGKSHGVDKLKDPQDPAQIRKVHELILPSAIVNRTSHIYRYILWRMTGQNRENYLSRQVGVNLPCDERKIAVLCGSESDVPGVQPYIEEMKGARFFGGVISCHRNPHELDHFVNTQCDGLYAVLCAGSKAFALPGVLDARLHAAGKDVAVVGVALGEPGSESLKAAQLSIEQLPGQPVVMDEISGGCYSGPEGLRRALCRLVEGELPPHKDRTEKPVKMNLFKN